MRKKQVKRKTTLPKIRVKSGRLKETELPVRGRTKNVIGASQADNLCGSQCGRDVENRLENGLKAKISNLFVPVVDKNNNPLMPTTCSRAKRWIKNGKGTGFWKKGIYCVRLNVEPSDNQKQEICLGCDTGSKKEAMTIKSSLHTYLNAQLDAVTWVKENIETRKNCRKSRRQRTTPYRKNKFYRNINTKKISPSTKSRWQWKLRMINYFGKLFAITHFNVEDVKAKTIKNARKWNISFSPLEYGKNWFYNELKKLGRLTITQGYETSQLRESAGLKKLKNKMSEKFEAHCVDSWVLANHTVGGHIQPDNIDMIYVKPLRFHRRQLHVMQPIKSGVRKKYGGTMSMGFKRGSIVYHSEYKLCFVGGTSISKGKSKNGYKIYKNERISLHCLQNGERLSQKINPSDIIFLTYNSFLIKKSIKNNIIN